MSSWSNLPTELLPIIFSKVNHQQLFWAASSVCRSWQLACWEHILWVGEVLHLSELLTLCDMTEELDLDYLMALALAKVMKSLFDPQGHMFPDVSRNCLHITLPEFLHDEHLVYVAERVPKLRSIFLPMSRITGKGFSKAVCNMTELESVSMGAFSDSHYTRVIQELGINCGKLKVLKIGYLGTPFRMDEYKSRVMADNLHSLDMLQLIGCTISKCGLQTIMSKSRRLVKISLKCCSRVDVKVTRCRKALEAKPFAYTPATLSLEISKSVNCNGWCVDALPGNHNIMTVIDHLWKQTGDSSKGSQDD